MRGRDVCTNEIRCWIARYLSKPPGEIPPALFEEDRRASVSWHEPQSVSLTALVRREDEGLRAHLHVRRSLSDERYLCLDGQGSVRAEMGAGPDLRTLDAAAGGPDIERMCLAHAEAFVSNLQAVGLID